MTAILPERMTAEEILDQFKTIEADFLGTGWAFIECQDGSAYWINMHTGTIVPSGRK